MELKYKLYGTELSLYSGKVRSYLRKKGIPFEEIQATLKVYKNFIIPRTGVRFIPVMQTPDDEVIQDTTAIIDTLEQLFPKGSVYPASPIQKLVALLLEVYGDEWLVIPAMHYRWNFPEKNQPFIYGEFGKIIQPNLPQFAQRWLGKKLGSKFKGMVPKLGINEKNIASIEASYLALLSELEIHFSQHNYLLGDRPSIADFGFIGPLYAHLYRDPHPGLLMRAKAPAVAKWVERMISDTPTVGEWAGDDEIPTTLLPVLERMAREQLPVLLDTDIKLSTWKQKTPNTNIPRSIGEHEFSIEGTVSKRIILPYSLWMFQRPINYYQSLSLAQQEQVDTLLTTVGFSDFLKKGLNNKLDRKNNQLIFAENKA